MTEYPYGFVCLEESIDGEEWRVGLPNVWNSHELDWRHFSSKREAIRHYKAWVSVVKPHVDRTWTRRGKNV